MFLLVPAYPGCPGSKAVKRSLLLLLLLQLPGNHVLKAGPEEAKCVEEEGGWGVHIPFLSRHRGLRECCIFLRGFWGTALAENDFGAFCTHTNHL